MPKLKHPVTMEPGELIKQAMINGYTHLVTVTYKGEHTNIVAGYTTAKAAEKAKDTWIAKLQKLLADGRRPLPEVATVATIDAWNKLRFSYDPSWMAWMAQGFLMAVVSGPADTNKMTQALGCLIAHQHRTNQQTIIRAMRQLLWSYHASEPGTDPRNEAAVKWVESVLALPATMPYV